VINVLNHSFFFFSNQGLPAATLRRRRAIVKENVEVGTSIRELEKRKPDEGLA